MRTPDQEAFDKWFARAHPFDWYERELGQPAPTALRMNVWSLCRAAWMREELPQRKAPSDAMCKHDDGDCHADDPCDDCPVYRRAHKSHR